MCFSDFVNKIHLQERMSHKLLAVTIIPFNYAKKEIIAKKWQKLEQKSNSSIFISWLWIGSWLDLVSEPLFLIEAYQNDKVVGLGFFVEKHRKVLGIFPVKQWWLHRTGDQKKDQIWIEHNDFLLDKCCANDVREAMVNAINEYDSSIDEIVVGLSTSEVLKSFAQKYKYVRSLINTFGYTVDISKVSNEYMLEILSKNTRSQINRSIKLLSQQGELGFRVISEKAELACLYDEISTIHIKRWEKEKEGSGFSNVIFTNFHQRLMNNDMQQNTKVVQVSVLSLDKTDIGYLINFVYNNTVYFYLSALTESTNNKIKIGLTLHSKAIQYYADKGIDSYDFLGGEARYKQSLSNNSYELSIVCFYKKNWVLTLDNRLKKIKSTFKKLY